MAEPFWHIKYKGKPIDIALNDLSNQRLRAMKVFGDAYGIPSEYMALLLRGDMDAVTCAVWINQQKAGGEVESLISIDFTLDDFEAIEDPPAKAKKAAKGKENPTRPSTTTDDSAETPSPTETDTSSTSVTSAD
jgi:hypothetical protein